MLNQFLVRISKKIIDALIKVSSRVFIGRLADPPLKKK